MGSRCGPFVYPAPTSTLSFFTSADAAVPPSARHDQHTYGRSQTKRMKLAGGRRRRAGINAKTSYMPGSGFFDVRVGKLAEKTLEAAPVAERHLNTDQY